MFQPGYIKSLPKPHKIVFNQHILFEDQVFKTTNGKAVFLGIRQTIARVIGPGIPGSARITILASDGVNPYPVGSIVEKPVANLLQGFDCNNHMKDGVLKLKSGGHLEGFQNGKKVILEDAEKGGIGKGSTHAEGGIKGTVGTNERPIEFEGEEIILTAPVASSTKKYEFEGQEMTGKQIASKINEDNGGVSFAKGGQPATACSCSH